MQCFLEAVVDFAPPMCSVAKEMPVTSFTFSAEQLGSAPPAVRQWIETEIAAALRLLIAGHQEPGHSVEVAACSPEEAPN